jgi:hypothetical protein
MNNFLCVTKIKNIISLKQILQLRIFCSSICERVSFDIIEDSPIYTMNMLNNNYISDDFIPNINSLFNINNSLLIIGILSLCYTIYNLDKKDSMKKIDNLLSYYEIRRAVNQIFIIISIIFLKNVKNAN